RHRPPTGARRCRLLPVIRHDRLLLFAEAGDAETHRLTRLQKLRRFHPRANPRGRTRGDDVAGRERHEAADIADEERHAEDHRLGIAALHSLAVDVEEHIEGQRMQSGNTKTMIFGVAFLVSYISRFMAL